MILPARSLRRKLLLGASLGSLVLAGGAEAQSGRLFGNRGGSDPAAAAARAAAAQAAKATQASSASQRAITAFSRAAATRKVAHDAQAAARAAALAAQAMVPNGLGRGGLQVVNGVVFGPDGKAIDTSLWLGAGAPTQTSADGRTKVTIDQTQQKAILTWESFNVGRETDLKFNQGGTDWVVLNRVNDPSADPTRILGTIKAPGSVYILNRNGVIFGGASQVNVRSLIAASADISNDRFLGAGIYSQLSGANYLPTFTGAKGAVKVEAGAQIVTNTPASVTSGGGFVLLMGTSVTNEGTILTPRGQVALAAGDNFLLRRGFGTEENKSSTTRGNEVRGLIDAGSLSGAVTNRGVLEASEGDVTLAGRTIVQDGVALATTTVNQRGTVHLLNSASDTLGTVTLGKNSLTAVLPELDAKGTALNSQRDALIAQSDAANLQRGLTITGGFDDRSLLADRLDLGRVEIVTGGNVTFASNSQTIANGGQVAVQANAGRITVEKDARIDVSGVMGVALDMASNAMLVNIQGNELRDSPGNRDSDALKNQNVWVDVRDLVLLPSGTGGYQGDRWYTKGGLLEVGGYLGNTAHGIGEWAAVGGTITLAAKEVVAHKGAVLDISGGSIDYAAGYVRSTLMLGEDGRMYDIRNAPAHLKMLAVGNAFVRKHERWGTQYTEIYTNPLFSRSTTTRWENGYSVGRDAGKLILSTPTAILEADILTEAYNGQRQTIARPETVRDSYALSQHTVSKGGVLAVGGYSNGTINPFTTEIRIGDVAAIAPELTGADPLGADRTGTVQIDAGYLNDQKLGGLELATRGTIAIERDVTLADGGEVKLVAPEIEVAATVTARGGRFSATNLLDTTLPGGPTMSPQPLVRSGASSFTLTQDGAIDLRGLWVNGKGQDVLPAGLGRIDGGSVAVEFGGNISIGAGSRIDVSSGAAILPLGELRGGTGGSVTLIAGSERTGGTPGTLTLEGDLAAYGVNGGGTLTLTTGNKLVIGAQEPVADALNVSADRFRSGFSDYVLNGQQGLSVAKGARVDVLMPVYRADTVDLTMPTGRDPSGAFELWTPPVYREDPLAGQLLQRGGASLSLLSRRMLSGGTVEIGKGATVSVDPGAAIHIAGPGQMTVEGRLNAWGGAITFDSIRAPGQAYTPVHDRSLWIGETAILDVAGRSTTAVDRQGRRYGVVQAGGAIELGGKIDWEGNDTVLTRQPDLHLVIRPGAILDASGSSAVLDLRGLDRNSPVRPVTVAGDGGTIVLAAASSMYVDGTLRAAAGGAGAAGGTLAVSFGGGLYNRNQAGEVMTPRSILLTQMQEEDRLGEGAQVGDKLAWGTAYLSVEQIEKGGFDNLSVFGAIQTPGDLTLNMAQSLRLAGQFFVSGDAIGKHSISLSAPYLFLNGNGYGQIGNPELIAVPALEQSQTRRDIFRATADHIDVRGDWIFNSYGDVALTSRGDIRMRAGVAGYLGGGSAITAAELLTLTANQIYVGSGAFATIAVGDVNVGMKPENRLVIRSNGGPAPAVPFSVGGRLTLRAGVIEQGGVVRAPLGSLTIGSVWDDATIRFLPGSLTSVSGAGLVMPYGGTADGIKYLYDGDELFMPGVGGAGSPARALQLEGKEITVDQGAVLDMSGGGDLKGAGFVSGRGGSIDVMLHPLADANPAFGFSSSDNQVYALVPGAVGAYAPIDKSSGAGAPAIGRQVTIPAGVPGLAAGTYTLMPSNYALLPGAFRVEIGKTSAKMTGVTPTGNGSFIAAGHLGTADTGIRSALASQLLITPADVVRKHSSYNEMGLDAFLVADAARRNIPRAMLTVDARALQLVFSGGAGLGDTSALTFAGTALFAPAKDSKGFGGILMVSSNGRGDHSLQVLADGQKALGGYTGAAIEASQLNAFKPSRIGLNSGVLNSYGFAELTIGETQGSVIVRSGATVRAPEIMLGGNVLVEQGATLSTIGLGTPGYDSSDGYLFTTTGAAFVVSNGWVNLMPSTGTVRPTIDIGGCAIGNVCSGTTQILTEGTIGAATNGAFTLRETVSYGARDLVLAVSSVNLGSTEALAQAGAAGQLPPGMALNQDVLQTLLNGNTAKGTPALQSLVLNARESFNIYGSVALDTLDPATGKYRLERLVFGAPAIFGYGSAGDTTTIRTGEFIWAGTGAANPLSTNRPGDAVPVAPGSAILDRLGGGTLNIVADTIKFGYAPTSQPVTLVPTDRMVLGFDTVNLTANKGISADANNGSLYVYRDQQGYTAGKGWSYSGGDLNITTPVLTGGAGGKLAVIAGGAIDIKGNGTAPAPADKMGAELRFLGKSIRLDTAVVLPSGKLVLDALNDVTLGADARIDMAGREVTLFDVKRYSWGGDVSLLSREGNVTTAAGSVIDLSARFNRGGTLDVAALGANAGRVDLLGAVRGKATGIYDAGGTLVPYDSAQFNVRAQTLVDFAGINARLNEGELFGARRFQLKQGDLVVGDGVKAREVQIVLDGGDLTVNGKIDASGYQVGAIRLAAMGDLTVNGTLDAHATGLRLDSYGKPIDAANRAVVELTSREGTLALGASAVVDLRAGTESRFADNVARGTLDLIAPRVGTNDVAVDVRGAIDVRGAKAIAVYGMRSYDDAPLATLPDVTGTAPQLVTQAYLDRIDGESRSFMDAALANGGLSARLAGLGNYRLRPGVEITTNAATNPAGNLTVAGDIDLSGYRYGPNADRNDPARRGFGEPGMLVLRAAGNINIHGSINDGFAPPATTPDDKGWMLTESRSPVGTGYTPFGGDIVIPIDGVQLETGTVFTKGATLNYDVPVRAVTLPSGSVVPTEVTLTGKMTLPAGLVLSADVTAADGTRYKAGSVLAQDLSLAAGAKLGAGFLLRSDAPVGAFTWPKGTKLPVDLTTNGRITLARGSVIPSMTKVELVGDMPVNIRPVGPDGRQGANWAMAPMLPQGTTSWDLTVVAGADLGSADVRAQNTLGTGDIVLADTHYGQIGKVNIRFEGGGGGLPVFTPDGALAWLGDAKYAGLTEAELDGMLQSDFGLGFRDLFGQTFADFCKDNAQSCTTKAPAGDFVLTPDGAQTWFGDAKYAGLTETELEAALQADYGLGIFDFLGQSFSDFCSGGGSADCVTKAPPAVFVLTPNGAQTWFGDAKYAGLKETELEAALQADYGLGIFDFLGQSFSDFCSGGGSADCVSTGGGGEPPKEVREYVFSDATPAFSVLRTGTGDLSLIAGRDIAMQSLFGVYTAGEQTSIPGIDNARFNVKPGYISSSVLADLSGDNPYAAVMAARQAWYPDQGGNLLVSAGRNITGDSMGMFAAFTTNASSASQARISSSAVGNWLWRQGTGSTTGIDPTDTSWWINFGTYGQVRDLNGWTVRQVGFTGFGALGGGNVRVQAAGDAGLVDLRGEALRGSNGRADRTQGLVVAIGSTGRVVGDDLVLTGGGDLDIRIGGALNPNALASQQRRSSGTTDDVDLNGVFTNLRGALTLRGGGMGAMTPTYGDGFGLRAPNLLVPGAAYSMAGAVLMLGDSTAWLDTRGDLVLGAASNPGLVELPYSGVHTQGGQALEGRGETDFSLWTAATSVNLFSAGGDLSPLAMGEVSILRTTSMAYLYYPSILRAVAPGGDIRIPSAPVAFGGGPRPWQLTLAPSATGQLELLAGGSVRAPRDGMTLSMSGASPDIVPTPFNPAFNAIHWTTGAYLASNMSREGETGLFAFGPNTITTALHANDPNPARIYAVNGDIEGIVFGRVLPKATGFGANGQLRLSDAPWYEMATAVQLRAGTDILGVSINAMNSRATDITLLQAGGDIVHANVNVAGPGNVELIAGGHIRQEDVGVVSSLGSLVPGDTRPGASIAMQAGMTGVDWQAVRTRYLDPTRQADPAYPLVHPENTGKVAKVYTKELGDWLEERFGFTGTTDQQLAYFGALAPEQQRIFLREVYYAETREGGREYNEPASSRFNSYLRGREMIATLFPDKDAAGAAITRTGDITLYSSESYQDLYNPQLGQTVRTRVTKDGAVRTLFGGDIEVMAPGGQVLVGIQGLVPGAVAGLTTQGAGDIRIFSEKSLLLGLSRIMTTFGGDIFAWSEQGDINAGRGAKTTILYTPPRRIYDNYGDVRLAPQVPSSGAGIATLAPIAEVPPGDVDLIAPLGVIDAGEAGIRVSGNVNLAALQVINAANIQVQGESRGIPLPPVINTGALTAASNASNAVVAQVAKAAERAGQTRRIELPSIITVTFAGFGD